MDNKKMVQLSDDMLDNISGGAIGFNPDGQGTYTMKCEFTGQTFYGVQLSDIIEIGKFAAAIPNTLEGENQIIAYARSQGYIH